MYDEQEQVPATPNARVTRTVAIIKHHALGHRFEIERRIQEASFEIVKERQMEFDVETDPEVLFELFGDDAESLGEGEVWVYVLERKRAVEVWKTLMGDRDPEVARQEAPNSLRALYGISLEKNGLMGSPDIETAETQILSLFASSPPFSTQELPEEGGYGSMRSMSSSVLDALRQNTSDEGYAPSNPSTKGAGANGKVFRARALPATHAAPDIVPRTTRAAALRAGGVVEKGAPSAPRVPLSKEQLAKTFANVPGHKRAESIAVASTAAPTIAPRMTRATALRLGLPLPAAPVRKASNPDTSDKPTFDGVPGHKRRETISVASVQAPTVAPRLNKSAALRASKDQAPPSSFQFRGPTAPKLPGLSRSNSTSSLQSKPPSRPASAASVSTPSGQRMAPRPSSVAMRPAASRPSILPAAGGPKAAAKAAAPAPTRSKPRPSSISAPSIAPRTNRSAALRAAKQEMENAAAAAKKLRAGGPRPSAITTF